MIVRWFAAFREGPYVFTSGWEWESLFAIWKWMHGEKVFADPFEPPFAVSSYNWLFYWTYGAFASGVISLLGLEPSALPSVARFLTVLLTLTSGILVYALLAPLNLLSRIAGSVVIALNPLIGFWSVTTRPDIAALVCDLAGLWCVKNAGRSGFVWLIPAWASFYGAWAFKQSFVAALTAACLYLFISGSRKQALLLGGGTAIAFAATLALGDTDYRYALLWSQAGTWLSASVAFHNCAWAFLKAPLFPLGLISILVSVRKIHLDLLALTGLVSFALMLPASGKIGASDNYFFESAVVCSIVFLVDLLRVPRICRGIRTNRSGRADLCRADRRAGCKTRARTCTTQADAGGTHWARDRDRERCQLALVPRKAATFCSGWDLLV